MNIVMLLTPAVTGIIVVIVLLAFFGLIVFGVIMLKRHSKFFKKDDEKPSEKEIVKEELNRVLEEVKDEETIKAMKDYSNNNLNNTNSADNDVANKNEEINK